MSVQQQIQHLSSEQVFSALQSSPKGLSDEQASGRLRELGANSIEVRDPWRLVRSLMRQLTNFFTLLLFASAAICFVAEHLQPGESMAILGWALAGVALLNALFSFVQEYRAEKAMAALRQFLPPMVQVQRNGKVQKLLAEELVPGDLLLLREGDRVPADARLVAAEGLMANNAPLTGEAQPVALSSAVCESRLVESNNVVFAGCQILRGTGEAIIFATGLRTEFGKLAHLSQAIHRDPSPLERQTAHMVRVLTVIAVTLGVAFFLYGVFSGRSLWVNLVFMMGIIVANVPEGLLPTFTLSLAMGSLRMARKNVLVTSLNAVEGLGAIQVICTDKTGTLTLNQLAVNRLTVPFTSKDSDSGEFRHRLLQVALLASDVHPTEQGFSGDPLDVAIATRLQQECSGAEGSFDGPVQFFPFDSELKRSAGLGTVSGEQLFAVKGAWEVLRSLISEIYISEQEICRVSTRELMRIDTILSELAGRGLRVVAVATRRMEEGGTKQYSQQQLERELRLEGFIAIEDPLREEVPAAIASCHGAGIDVILITGDHPATAASVAVQCGIIEEKDDMSRVMTGDVLEQSSDLEIQQALERGVRIFARTSPAQKMKIVMAMKSLGRVVAMTGDGVNDAPALKAADVGIAMGKGGTDVARAAAQIILLDDNFASIVAGIEEGRTVFINIRKFTNYVLVSNGPEILPYLLYVLLPVPLALTVIQILSIDLGTDIIPSMALGQEPPEPEAMLQPPRSREFHLLSRGLVLHSYLFLGLLEALWSLALFFYVLLAGGWQYGTDLASNDPLYRSATGIALATILLMQIGNLVGRRYRVHSGLDRGLLTNRLLLLGILIQVVFSWGLLYFPPLQKILGTAPVAWPVYLLAWCGIPLIFGADYLRKRIFLAT
ncbi:sodium/potassium-transporting ATPase subunit alpha [Malonomonas rubra DSM 5091]|uniref:Sodium/potassium-transporting ATPase subunit alpha n=1 Tax=Malonomonas rubra DSM 5091 TaxID=1122189 RepID=A0A1M6NFZ1_MALRU|nr:cation-transporting P-type ATPase [Malonomonas rubra]SHJ94544.1 sodium/potassium-transporting ATPase subunit alpha [Malonomonas rubra DSM 5091]